MDLIIFFLASVYRKSEYRMLEKLPDRQADRLYKKLSTVKLDNKELFYLGLSKFFIMIKISAQKF